MCAQPPCCMVNDVSATPMPEIGGLCTTPMMYGKRRECKPHAIGWGMCVQPPWCMVNDVSATLMPEVGKCVYNPHAVW